jgi:hypothetical protein
VPFLSEAGAEGAGEFVVVGRATSSSRTGTHRGCPLLRRINRNVSIGIPQPT